MPVYQYICPEAPETPVELLRTIAQRDCPVNAVFTGRWAGHNRPIYRLPENGQLLVLEREAAQIHDVITFRRKTVPARIVVCGHAADPHHETPLDAFREYEEKHGGPDTAREFAEFGSLRDIRRIWEEPAPSWEEFQKAEGRRVKDEKESVIDEN